MKNTDPLMKAKLKSKTHVLNTFFDFWAVFCAAGFKLFKKVLILIKQSIKKRRISRWFRIRWKSRNKMNKKSNMQNKYDKHE